MENTKNSELFTKELEAAGQAADGAKSILMNYFGQLQNIREKDQAGLVSEADCKSEEFIFDFLSKKFPEYMFLGEETGMHSTLVEEMVEGEVKKNNSLDPETCWIVDPLDGTTNYVHGFSVFCISIALKKEGELVVAVIDAPMLGQRFTAVKGGGAFLNGKPIQVSQRKDIDRILLGTGFSVSRPKELQNQLALLGEILHLTRGIRRAGAAAYDLCMVASGVYDGFWESCLKPWDTAAGALLVKEAGGVVTDSTGIDYQPEEPFIIAGSSYTHKILAEKISSFENG